MAGEIAPFGLGVTILVTGTYDTDIITDAGTTDDRELRRSLRPAARHDQHARAVRGAASRGHRSGSPTAWSRRSRTAAPFRRHGVGLDASMLLASNRILPSSGMHHMSRLVMGIPRQGAMRGGAVPLTGCPAGDGVRGQNPSAAGVGCA